MNEVVEEEVAMVDIYETKGKNIIKQWRRGIR
jgi:hypothetical protein